MTGRLFFVSIMLSICAGLAHASESESLAVLEGDIQNVPGNEGPSLGRIRVLKRSAWGHPNELWRLYALEAMHLGRTSGAAAYFERAALYADKYSQHRLSLLYWHGQGVLRDRSRAYVWADLAAERGYRDLLLVREKMWSELSRPERDAVEPIGAVLYTRFGDAAAKPRLERKLKYALTHATGSRTGFEIDRIGMLQRNGEDVIAGNFWARERWDPEEYWKGVNADWGGYVEVRPLIPAGEEETPKQTP